MSHGADCQTCGQSVFHYCECSKEDQLSFNGSKKAEKCGTHDVQEPKCFACHVFARSEGEGETSG